MVNAEKPAEHFTPEDIQKFVEANYWKVRKCGDYKLEYEECTAWRSRFHQYFVHGEFSDCSSWKDDMINCEKSLDDLPAFASIIRHEDERKNKRIQNHMANDVWAKRKSPPDNWDADLPDFIREKQKHSFEESNKESNSCVIF